jgi:hypothetical protein
LTPRLLSSVIALKVEINADNVFKALRELWLVKPALIIGKSHVGEDRARFRILFSSGAVEKD